MLGKGGVTHNMLDDIHNHWKRAEAVRIKCLGVPTLDMENVCFHLEVQTQHGNSHSGRKFVFALLGFQNSFTYADCSVLQDKCGGKIIYRNINIILLYRGRNYDPKNRPVVPLMLWKPYAPIYPKLVKPVAGGLTFEETKEMRNRGLNSPPVMKLSKRSHF